MASENLLHERAPDMAEITLTSPLRDATSDGDLIKEIDWSTRRWSLSRDDHKIFQELCGGTIFQDELAGN